MTDRFRMDLDNEELKATRELSNLKEKAGYVSKEKIRELKNFYIKCYEDTCVDLIPLKNIIDNLDMLLGG